MKRAKGSENKKVGSPPDNREQTAQLLNRYLMAQFVLRARACSEQPRHACPSRRYDAVVQRTACATPYVPPPCRGGRAPSDFSWSNGLQIGRRRFGAPREAIPPSSQMNSNLVETRTKHSHLQSITTLAFAFRGHAGV